jgi:threonine dehydratase
MHLESINTVQKKSIPYGSPSFNTMQNIKQLPISSQEVLHARKVVSRFLRPTALTHYPGLSIVIGAQVYVKHENHQPTGVFKIRGGINLVHHLLKFGFPGILTTPPGSERPTIGNSNGSILTAAQWLGLKSLVVVQESTNPLKVQAFQSIGADVFKAGETPEDCQSAAEELCHKFGYYHASTCDEPLLINGVGTGFLEIVEELPDMDVMIIPLGGGTEAAAAITVLRAVNPEVEIIAVQAEKSPAAWMSWKEGRMVEADSTSMCLGIALGHAFRIPFEIYKNGLTDFILLSEEEIYNGIGLAWYYTHNLAESAGAVTVAAALKLRQRLQGKKVVLQMSGGNAPFEEIKEAIKRPAFLEGFP